MKKSLAAEMFWVTFRLHAGLPITPRDPHAGEDGPSDFDAAVASLFERNEKRNAHSEMALLLLCSFAEGRFDRPKKTRKTKNKVRHLKDIVSNNLDAFCFTKSPYRPFSLSGVLF